MGKYPSKNQKNNNSCCISLIFYNFKDTMTLSLILLLLTSLFISVTSLFQTLSFSKLLFIPGGYFSLMNFTRNFQPLGNYYDISVDFTLTQTSFGDQGNSIYDFFSFNTSHYKTVQPCYQSATNYLNTLYSQYEPCQGGCAFESQSSFNQNYTQMNLMDTNLADEMTLIIDNTFYPCNGGTYQSTIYLIQIYLYEMLNLTIESNLDYFFILKIVFVALLQIFIFLFAYIMIMINKLQNKKKKIKKMRQQKQDLEVMHAYERQGE